MKHTKKEGSRASITQLPILPGTLILCGCTLLLFLGIILAMYAGGMVTMPSFLEAIFGTGDDPSGEDGFSSEFLNSLRGNAPALDTPDEELLDLSPDALRSLLLAADPADSYCQTADVIWTDGESFRRTTVVYAVSDGCVYAEIHPADGTMRTVICDGEQLLLREEGEERIFACTDTSAVTPESEAGLPSLARMQEMIAQAEEGKYTLSLETSQNSPCIRVRFTDTLSGVEEIFDVLPDLGLILNASSMLPGTQTPYYQMTTTSVLTDLSGMDNATFVIVNP